MQWYYSKNGTQLGPVPQDELVAKLAGGEVASTDLVWREGMADWLPAGQQRELSNTVAPQAPLQAPPVGGGETPVSPYSPPISSGSVPPAGDIPNYLWQSIVVTLFCCLPFGIVAIVFAAKVDTLKAQGNIAAALSASSSAKTWCWVSFGIGLAVMGLYFVGIIAGAVANSP